MSDPIREPRPASHPSDPPEPGGPEAGPGRGPALVHAEVVGPVEKQWCRVRFETAWPEPASWVRIAVPPPYRPAPGDLLLVARGREGSYAIGVLEKAAAEGADTFREGPPERERLGVRDGQGRVLFEYEPARERAVLHVPDGDLELRAGRRLDLVAGEQVRLVAGRGLEIAGGGPVEISSGAGTGTALRLDERRASLRAPRLDLDTREAAVRAERVEARCTEVDVQAGRIRVAARRLETAAERIVQRARSLHQSVEGLHQMVAGRVRQLVEGALHLRSGRLDLRGRRGVRVDGEKIHLG